MLGVDGAPCIEIGGTVGTAFGLVWRIPDMKAIVASLPQKAGEKQGLGIFLGQLARSCRKETKKLE
jgi:hypothetical protein